MYTLRLTLACVASVSVRSMSKERGTRVNCRAKNGASKRAGRGWGGKEGNLPSTSPLFHFLALVSFLARSKPKIGSFSRYRKALYFWSLGISLYLELFSCLSFITIILRNLCSGMKVLRISSDGDDGRICFLVWNFRFRNFFGLENLASIFLGGLSFGSLNFIRLLRVVITPPVTALLRGENDSKQSDEFQARVLGYSRCFAAVLIFNTLYCICSTKPGNKVRKFRMGIFGG